MIRRLQQLPREPLRKRTDRLPHHIRVTPELASQGRAKPANTLAGLDDLAPTKLALLQQLIAI
jgi:hypothetical protein